MGAIFFLAIVLLSIFEVLSAIKNNKTIHQESKDIAISIFALFVAPISSAGLTISLLGPAPIEYNILVTLGVMCALWFVVLFCADVITKLVLKYIVKYQPDMK